MKRQRASVVLFQSFIHMLSDSTHQLHAKIGLQPSSTVALFLEHEFSVADVPATYYCHHPRTIVKMRLVCP